MTNDNEDNRTSVDNGPGADGGPGPHSNRRTGARGEQIAAEHLEERGYRVLDRNWRCPDGEVDLVVADDDWVAVVEVKTRNGPRAGHPFEAVTPAKAARLRRLAIAWARAHPGAGHHLRIDVVAVTLGDAGPVVEHLENVS